MKDCPMCGASIAEDDVYCYECGSNTKEIDEVNYDYDDDDE